MVGFSASKTNATCGIAFDQKVAKQVDHRVAVILAVAVVVGLGFKTSDGLF